jgi:ABC-type bacteriocin/lantibiotic exporter with double-glycine peptidase domain
MSLRLIGTVALVLWVHAVLLAADPAGIWLDVPFVAQERDGCGPASIAMLMRYWQQQPGGANVPRADVAEIDRALSSRAAHGVYASEMELFLQRQGYRTFAFRGEWEDLKHHLEKGRPLIVALKPGAKLPLHYVVVTGLDWDQGLVLVNDPAQRKLLKEERTRFDREWNGAQRWMLLAVPQAQAP